MSNLNVKAIYWSPKLLKTGFRIVMSANK